MRDIQDPQTLTQNLGGKWHRSYGVAPCPICQPERRKDQDALTISCNNDRLLLHCKKTGCDFRDILVTAGIPPGNYQIDPRAVEKAQRAQIERASNAKACARFILGHTRGISGSPGETYLRDRGITCALPETLGWAPEIYHGPSGQSCAAMVAQVSTGGIHRTFFDKQGKRLRENAKMMLGPCAGGAVRLSEGDGPLVVCEGIETGLSLLSGLLDGPKTVWAALSTSGMAGVTLPPPPGALIVATDGDAPGREAGDKLARRADALGWDVSLMPAPDARDWNDVLQSGVMV